jgi:insertion element IS1 protein InsB
LFEFEVGDGSKSTYLKMAFRIEKGYKIKHLCTDGNKVYGYYKISESHHITKSETCLVESWNCRLRHYLARLHRRTLCYSKSIEALRNSVLLLIHKEIALSVFI